LTTAADRAAKSKAFARSRVEQARQSYQQRDFVAARKFIDDADAADPNQPATLNLRGGNFARAKQFDQAEAEFKKALKARFKIPAGAVQSGVGAVEEKGLRHRARSIRRPSGQGTRRRQSEAAQLIKFNVYMTWLLEGKDSRARN